jgi:hypothetical protein
VQLHQSHPSNKLQSNQSDNKKIMLQNTDYQPQVIVSGGQGKFKIAFSALQCGKFEALIPYSINQIHTFQLLVEADIELVALTINKPCLKMGYLDDMVDILMRDSFTLKN